MLHSRSVPDYSIDTYLENLDYNIEDSDQAPIPVNKSESLWAFFSLFILVLG